jgi:hypothetical protein
METETFTLEIKKKAVNKILKALKEIDESLSFKQWLELELNKNTDAIIEMLLSDY